MTERQNDGLQDEELVSVFNLWFDQFVSKPTSIFGSTTQFLFGVNGGKVLQHQFVDKKIIVVKINAR